MGEGMCQRWAERRHSWRHVSEGGFDARRFEVAEVAEATAKQYVTRHHYSGTYPATRLRFGLFEGAELVGVAALSVPVRAAVLTGVFPDLEPYAETLELGRLVLADRVPANAESWMLARAFELAERAGVRGVVSFSDPCPRITAEGRTVMPGHVGIIYQALNAECLGRGRARLLLMLPDGRTLNDRALAKVRAQQRGHEYVERALVRYGARPLALGENPAAWLVEALDAAGVRRVRHRGNHRYAFALGTPAERRALRRAIPLDRTPYPKTVDEVAA